MSYITKILICIKLYCPCNKAVTEIKTHANIRKEYLTS